MCLDIKRFAIKHTARKDIVVYKWLLKDTQLKNFYRTPYMKFLVRMGDLCKRS